MDFQKVEMRALSDDQLDATSGGGLPLRADAKAAPSQSSQGGQIDPAQMFQQLLQQLTQQQG